MDFKLTKEQELIQRAAREYALNVILPLTKQIEQEDKIPQEVWDGMADLGFLGMPFEEEFGGGGAGYENYVLVQEQISRVSSGVGTVFSVHMMGSDVIALFGSKEQQEKYLPRTCLGELKPSFAFTEPQTGSDPKQLTTTAAKDGKYVIINGVKRFISNAGYEGPMVVFCKDVDTGGFSAYIIDKFCEGYSLSKPWEKIGSHGSPIFDVYLKDVRIPYDNLLGEPGKGFDILLLGIAFGKIGTSSIALGGILAAYEEALKYAKEKLHRGKPIAKFQAIQLKIGHLAAKYYSTRWMCYRLGTLANDILAKNTLNSAQFQAEAALVKSYASDTAVEAAKLSMDVHASYGLTKDYPIERIYRDAIISPQIEGVSDMQRIIWANYVLN
ncbi:butyryl-coa dehydrogenase [hydrocarbon metagenome]|uniref:Butyryl-coa dehydrogenase n=1 Tax=hydrocarbon metagenome TaxID=938273 RepID=A0A0W8E2V0_9ZZZZ